LGCFRGRIFQFEMELPILAFSTLFAYNLTQVVSFLAGKLLAECWQALAFAGRVPHIVDVTMCHVKDRKDKCGTEIMTDKEDKNAERRHKVT
jgi:hypothetical protein